MTTNTDKPKLTLVWLTKHCTKMFGKVFDLHAKVLDLHTFSSARMAALENRLARIDGGDDAEAARHSALAAANDARRRSGDEPLAFDLVVSGDNMHAVFHKDKTQ